MRYIILIVWLCSTILLTAENTHAAAGDNPELLIVPGVGVGLSKIGTRSRQKAQPDGIKTEPADSGIVKKIKVTSDKYYVQYNHMHVGDQLQKIFRFYPKLAKEAKDKDLTILRDLGQGIEFTVDMKTEKITEIGVSEPVVPDYYKRKSQRSETIKAEKDAKSEKALMRNYYKENLK